MDHRTLINKPKSERGRETLNRILSAAAQTFYEKGYHDASISEIANMAGVATGTVYVYFDSKYDLYKFLLFQCGQMIRKHLSRATRNCKTRHERESAGMQAWLEFVLQNRYVYHIIWEALYVDKELFREYYEKFGMAYIRGIDAAKERGEIRPGVNSEVLAWTFMGAASFLGLNWSMFKDYPTNLEKVTEHYMSIISDGIFTDSARSAARFEHLPIQIQVEFDDDEDCDLRPAEESGLAGTECPA